MLSSESDANCGSAVDPLSTSGIAVKDTLNTGTGKSIKATLK